MTIAQKSQTRCGNGYAADCVLTDMLPASPADFQVRPSVTPGTHRSHTAAITPQHPLPPCRRRPLWQMLQCRSRSWRMRLGMRQRRAVPVWGVRRTFWTPWRSLLQGLPVLFQRVRLSLSSRLMPDSLRRPPVLQHCKAGLMGSLPPDGSKLD